MVVHLWFRNLGMADVGIRTDIRDRSVHRFRLIRSDGTEAARHSNPPSTSQVVAIPGDFLRNQEMGVSGLETRSWELDLSKEFDISQPGSYRLEYAYIPPETPQPSELDEIERFRFWNGREYTEAFEFRVVP